MKLHELTYLVVDDLELMRAVTVNQLRALGCEKIKVARNGASALETLRSGKVDVVLCDWNMPVMSGLDLLKTVRADPELAKLPFLMITAEAERTRIEEVIHAGVSGLLVKPYNAGNLKARLDKVLSVQPRAARTTAGLGVPAPHGAQKFNRRATDITLAPSRILVVDDYPVSLKLLEHVGRLAAERGFCLGNLDATIIAQAPKLAPHIVAMRTRLAAVLGIAVDRVNVKAKTAEKLGPVGRQLPTVVLPA